MFQDAVVTVFFLAVQQVNAVRNMDSAWLKSSFLKYEIVLSNILVVAPHLNIVKAQSLKEIVKRKVVQMVYAVRNLDFVGIHPTIVIIVH